MQQIAMEHTAVKEMWEIMVNNPDSDTLVLNFVDTTKEKIGFYTSSLIRANANANTWETAIYGFYKSVWSCTVTVEQTLYGVSGDIVDSMNDAT